MQTGVYSAVRHLSRWRVFDNRLPSLQRRESLAVFVMDHLGAANHRLSALLHHSRHTPRWCAVMEKERKVEVDSWLQSSVPLSQLEAFA